MPSTNLEKIYNSPYRSFNFQQLFFYDIFCATRILRIIGRQSIVYKTITTVCIDATALSDHLRATDGHLLLANVRFAYHS